MNDSESVLQTILHRIRSSCAWNEFVELHTQHPASPPLMGFCHCCNLLSLCPTESLRKTNKNFPRFYTQMWQNRHPRALRITNYLESIPVPLNWSLWRLRLFVWAWTSPKDSWWPQLRTLIHRFFLTHSCHLRSPPSSYNKSNFAESWGKWLNCWQS